MVLKKKLIDAAWINSYLIIYIICFLVYAEKLKAFVNIESKK